MKKFHEYSIGDKASLSKTFTEADVIGFAELSLDKNPVHLDAEYAKGTIFKQRIVHGMFYAALISGVLGTQCPGYGTIYMAQTCKFKAPVYIGDTVTATVEIVEMNTEKKTMRIITNCTKQDGTMVIEGEAMVKRLE